MMTLYPWLQLFWSGLVGLVIAERAVALFVRLPVSAEAAAAVARSLRAGERTPAIAWARDRADTLLGQLIRRALDQEDDPLVLYSELAQQAGARLLWIRTAATLSSVLGLLGGVLALAGGFGGQRGLLALEKGLAERVALDHALLAMALGVGTAGVCFFALSRMRPAYHALVTQAQTVAHLLPSPRAS